MSDNYHIKISTAATGTITAAYMNCLHRKMLVLFILIGVVFLIGVYAITQGAYEIPIRAVLGALTGQLKGASGVVIRNIRLPRVIAALVCGWGLSISGLTIQSLLKNPLGSPSTLGISHGAAFGAALSIVAFGGKVFSVTMFAFGGAMTATFVILLLSGLKKLSPETIILAGVALSALFSSATILIQYLATETELAMVVFWTFGDVARSSWHEILILSVSVAAASIFLTALRWDLNALSSGEETAKGLGVNVEKIRIAGMIAAAIISALATAFHGIIAFIGLIAPHMAKRLVGDDHGMLIPFSAVIGALLLLISDTLGRVFIGSGALPVGVITSFFGAPIFLYLLIRGYK